MKALVFTLCLAAVAVVTAVDRTIILAPETPEEFSGFDLHKPHDSQLVRRNLLQIVARMKNGAPKDELLKVIAAIEAAILRNMHDTNRTLNHVTQECAKIALPKDLGDILKITKLISALNSKIADTELAISNLVSKISSKRATRREIDANRAKTITSHFDLLLTSEAHINELKSFLDGLTAIRQFVVQLQENATKSSRRKEVTKEVTKSRNYTHHDHHDHHDHHNSTSLIETDSKADVETEKAQISSKISKLESLTTSPVHKDLLTLGLTLVELGGSVDDLLRLIDELIAKVQLELKQAQEHLVVIIKEHKDMLAAIDAELVSIDGVIKAYEAEKGQLEVTLHTDKNQLGLLKDEMNKSQNLVDAENMALVIFHRKCAEHIAALQDELKSNAEELEILKKVQDLIEHHFSKVSSEKLKKFDSVSLGVSLEYSYRTGNWRPCSVSCGEGVQKRKITCVNYAGEPAMEDKCLGLVKPADHQPCFTRNCPVDCVVSAWRLGECSVTCGTGVRTDTRSILTQDGYGGKPCPELSKAETCTQTACEPFNRANLKLWLDGHASTSVVLDPQTGRVSSWRDSGASGRSMTQLRAINQPAYTAASRTLSFTGTAAPVVGLAECSFLSMSSSESNGLFSNTNGFSMVVVASRSPSVNVADTSKAAFVAGWNLGQNNGAGRLGDRAYQSSMGQVTFTPPASNDLQVYIVTAVPGQQAQVYINGVSAGSAPLKGAIFTAGSPFLVGAAETSCSYSWTGAVGEVMVLDTALSSDSVTTLTVRLKQKWQIA